MNSHYNNFLYGGCLIYAVNNLFENKYFLCPINRATTTLRLHIKKLTNAGR